MFSTSAESQYAFFRTVALSLVLILLWQIPANAAEEEDAGQRPNRTVSTIDRGLEVSHYYVSRSVDQLALWLDRFLGGDSIDYDVNKSVVRLRHSNIFEESETRRDKLRVRMKLLLPNTEERLNLIFNSETDATDTSDALSEGINDESQTGELGLQLRAVDRRRFDLDYRLGFKSGLRARASIRANYLYNFSEITATRIRSEIYWLDRFGFGSRVTSDLDRELSANSLVRLRARLDFNEEERGVPWQTQLSWNRFLEKSSVVSLYLLSYGETRPDQFAEAYGPGVLYRRTLGKPWFYTELEPRYLFVKDSEPETRKGVASFILRFEWVFDEQSGKYWH